MTIFRRGKKELRSIDYLVAGRNHLEGYHKALFWGSIFFNVFINDFFFLVEETEVCNYADDTIIYVCDNNLKHVVSSLETDAHKLSKWFLDNNMKLKPGKYHPLIFGEKNTEVSVQVCATL